MARLIDYSFAAYGRYKKEFSSVAVKNGVKEKMWYFFFIIGYPSECVL
jgi:hypothetical protein